MSGKGYYWMLWLLHCAVYALVISLISCRIFNNRRFQYTRANGLIVIIEQDCSRSLTKECLYSVVLVDRDL